MVPRKKKKIIASYFICRKIRWTEHLLYIFVEILSFIGQFDSSCAEMGVQELQHIQKPKAIIQIKSGKICGKKESKRPKIRSRRRN